MSWTWRDIAARAPLFLSFLAAAHCSTRTKRPPDGPLERELVIAGTRTEGRFDRSEPDALTFAWSGSRIGVRFSGTSAAVDLEEAGLGNEYYVLVDGQVKPEKLVTRSGRRVYDLASALSDVPHEIGIYRLTEASLGETKFRGFRLDGEGKLLPLGPAPARRIEVIGDSISAGYGNEGSSKTCPFSPDTENHYWTYEAIVARAVRAELVTIAWSGKGVFSNRGRAEDPVVMPALWQRTLPEREQSRWDFSRYEPNAVIINLGTNDFVAETKDWSPFAAAYLAFVKQVRARYPRAAIFCALGPMMSDHWPPGRMALTTARTAIETAVHTLGRQGDEKVNFLEFPVQTEEGGYGCDWHPNVRTHELMAKELERELRAKMDW